MPVFSTRVLFIIGDFGHLFSRTFFNSGMLSELKIYFPTSTFFSADNHTDKKSPVIPFAPITNYSGFIRPQEDKAVCKFASKFAEEITKNIIADFEKNRILKKYDGDTPDLMVHVSTFKIIGDTVFMTYYANTETDGEDPSKQGARFAFCPADMTIVRIQKVGDMPDGKKLICFMTQF